MYWPSGVGENDMAFIATLRSAAICARIRPLALFPATLPRKDLNLQAATQPAGLKCLDDLPGPNLYKIISWLFVKGYADKLHLLQVGAAAAHTAALPGYLC